MKNIENKQDNNGIWIWTRISFWAMIIMWFVALFITDTSNFGETSTFFKGFAFIWFTTSISTFIFSILHLNKIDKKALAIVALILSTYILTSMFLGMLMLIE